MQYFSIGLDVVVLERVKFVCDVGCLVAQKFDLLLIGFKYVQRVFDFFKFGVHVALSCVDDSAKTSECA